MPDGGGGPQPAIPRAAGRVARPSGLAAAGSGLPGQSGVCTGNAGCRQRLAPCTAPISHRATKRCPDGSRASRTATTLSRRAPWLSAWRHGDMAGAASRRRGGAWWRFPPPLPSSVLQLLEELPRLLLEMQRHPSDVALPITRLHGRTASTAGPPRIEPRPGGGGGVVLPSASGAALHSPAPRSGRPHTSSAQRGNAPGG